MKWLMEDPGTDAEFWRPNIRSMPKFRAKYEQLRAVMNRRSTSEAKRDHDVNSLWGRD